MPERIEGHVAHMEQSVAELTQLTAELTRDQQEQLARLRRMAIYTTFGLIFDLILTAAGGLLLATTARNSDRIDDIQHRTSVEALCPLYDIFLDSYSLESPASVADPAGYQHSIQVIERGAAALGCPHTTRGRD